MRKLAKCFYEWADGASHWAPALRACLGNREGCVFLLEPIVSALHYPELLLAFRKYFLDVFQGNTLGVLAY